MDGDCNFCGDVDELNDFKMGDAVIAAPQTGRQHHIFKALGILQEGNNLKTGTMLFDAERYRWRRHWDNMQQIIQTHGRKFNSSTVNCAINLEFNGEEVVRLSDAYSFSAKGRKPQPGTKIIHWSICEPWNDEMMKEKPEIFRVHVNKYWRPYEAT